MAAAVARSLRKFEFGMQLSHIAGLRDLLLVLSPGSFTHRTAHVGTSCDVQVGVALTSPFSMRTSHRVIEGSLAVAVPPAEIGRDMYKTRAHYSTQMTGENCKNTTIHGSTITVDQAVEEKYAVWLRMPSLPSAQCRAIRLLLCRRLQNFQTKSTTRLSTKNWNYSIRYREFNT
jgi:hypothetical protein